MKINELTKSITEKFGIEVTNREVIDFLKEHDFKVSSHMQNATSEMIALIDAEFKPKSNDIKSIVEEEPDDTLTVTSVENKEYEEKRFSEDDLIPCKSVTPYRLNAVGVDKTTVYHWEYFGDEDYVSYKDLRHLRRSDYITKPLIIIEDPALCYQWRKELQGVYKHYIGVEYPEEFFDKSDDEFRMLLKRCPDTLKDVIKITAFNMIKNKNYPTLQKLSIIDDELNTCLKEFV